MNVAQLKKEMAETLENARKETLAQSNDVLDAAKKHSNSVARTTLETAEEHANKKIS